MALGNTDLTDFRTLLAVRKRIPQYQRDFVWEPNLIGTFLENIWDAFKDEKDQYFCGSLVVFRSNDDVYEIVDGQQRTTVLYTLISLMIGKIAELTEDDEFLGEQRAKHIYSRNRDNRQIKDFHYSHRNEQIKVFYESLGMGEAFEGKGNSDDIATKSLLNCREEVTNFIKDKISEAKIKDIENFYFYVLDRVKFTHFIASDMTEALLVYSRLNSGGKPLGHLEIIKGQLFEATQNEGEDKWDKLESLWNDFWIKFKTPIKIGGYGTARDLIGDETFLAYYFLVHHADLVNQKTGSNDGFLPAKKMIDFLLDPAVKKKVFGTPERFLKSLISFVDTLINYRLGEHEDETCKNSLTDLALLSQTQTQPLMFLLSCSYDQKLLKAVLPLAMKLVFIFTMSVTGSGSTSNVWKTLAKEVRNNKRNHTSDDIIRILSARIREDISYYWKNNFLPFIDNCSLETDRRKIKVILLICEIAARQEANLPGDKNYHNFYFQKGYDVDHLTPSSNSDDEYVEQIGNAALLGSSVNRSLKTIPFEEDDKKRALSRSDIFTTRALVSSPEEERGANKVVMKMFSVIDELNQVTADKRKSEIIECLSNFVDAN